MHFDSSPLPKLQFQIKSRLNLTLYVSYGLPPDSLILHICGAHFFYTDNLLTGITFRVYNLGNFLEYTLSRLLASVDCVPNVEISNNVFYRRTNKHFIENFTVSTQSQQ